MVLVYLIPIALSFLLLGAHFLHHQNLVLMAISLAVPWILFIRRRWALRVVQAVLVIATLEWIRTAVLLAEKRLDAGDPWKRMVFILGTVALWTLGSALLFQTPRMLRRYRLTRPDKITPGSKTL